MVEIKEKDPDSTELDFRESQKIKLMLVEESQHDFSERLKILGKLNNIVRQWVKQCGKDDGQDEDCIENSGGAVCTFGSSRLGVAGKGADIDTLCIVPKHIERHRHFFDKLVPILEATPGVKDLTAVKEAFVPLVKMTFDNVDIDLLFACVQAKKVDKEPNLLDNNILRGCAADDIKSLNGCRVTDKINELVAAAGPKSIHNFQTTLKCVKLWAKNRGVYSNVLGYPGGVAWALLVAKICINHPKLEPNQLLPRFFQYYLDYNWSYDNPVTLEEPIQNDPNIIGFQLPDDGKLFYKQMHQHKMPIITPAFPAQNATHNISESTKKVILTELEKASLITKALVETPDDDKLSWARLFKKFPFFKAFEHFIEV